MMFLFCGSVTQIFILWKKIITVHDALLLPYKGKLRSFNLRNVINSISIYSQYYFCCVSVLFRYGGPWNSKNNVFKFFLRVSALLVTLRKAHTGVFAVGENWKLHVKQDTKCEQIAQCLFCTVFLLLFWKLHQQIKQRGQSPRGVFHFLLILWIIWRPARTAHKQRGGFFGF